MPLFLPGQGAYDRREDGLPPIICENMYPERIPSEIGADWVLVQTPGKRVFSRFGFGVPTFEPRGTFSAYGVFNGDIFAVVGQSLSRVDIDGNSMFLPTALPVGNDIAIFASVRGYVALTVGGQAFVYDGATVTQITQFSDGSPFPAVSSVAAMDGRLIFSEAGSDRIYWSEIFDPTNVNVLGFATAETFEDDITRIIADHRELWLFGQQTIEIWRPTPDFEQPFQRIGDLVLEKGTLSPNSVVKADNTLYWVGQDAIVYKAQGASFVRISNHGIDIELSRLTQAELSNVFAFSYTDDGHIFYVMTIPDVATFVYDAATQAWHTRKSQGFETWDTISAENAFSRTYSQGREGLSELSREFVFDEIVGDTTMAGGILGVVDTNIQRVFSINIPTSHPQPIERLGLVIAVLDEDGGETGDNLGLNQSVVFTFSDDAGRTFSQEEDVLIQPHAQYNQRVTIFRQGQMRSPGRVYRVSTSLGVRSRYLIGPAYVNEPLH